MWFVDEKMMRERIRSLEEHTDKLVAQKDALMAKLDVWERTGNAIMLCVVGREAPLSDSDVCGEINALRQQVAELQTMHNAVPVNAISRYYYGTMQIDGVYSDDEYNSDSSSIEIWMDGMTD